MRSFDIPWDAIKASFDRLSSEEREVVGDPEDYDWDHPIENTSHHVGEAMGRPRGDTPRVSVPPSPPRHQKE